MCIWPKRKLVRKGITAQSAINHTLRGLRPVCLLRNCTDAASNATLQPIQRRLASRTGSHERGTMGRAEKGVNPKNPTN